MVLDGRPVEVGPIRPPEMTSNSVLQTERGRAEVLLNACAVLQMDANSSIRLVSDVVAYPRVELLAGTAVVQVDGGRANAVGVKVRQTVFRLGTNGFYRLETEPPRIKVYEGIATVNGSKTIGAGHLLLLPDSVAKFDRNEKDDLEWWRESRIRALAKQSGLTAINRANHQSVLERDRICPPPPRIGIFAK